MSIFIRNVPNVMKHYRCSAEDARCFIDLRDEGYSTTQAALLAGLIDPPGDDHIPSGLGAVDRVDSGAGSESAHLTSRSDSASTARGAPCRYAYICNEEGWCANGCDNASSPENSVIADLGGWRPIDTAPSDVPVLLYTPNLHFTNPERIEARVYRDSRGGHQHAWATHWMPLPAAPAAATGGKTA